MKKITISEEKIKKIIRRHYKYCRLIVKEKNLKIDKEDCKLLFAKNPFDDNFNLKPIYMEKFDHLKAEYDFRNNYTKFRRGSTKESLVWNGVKLIEELGIDVCPYCGQQYFTIVPNKEKSKFKIAEATLDHFLCKKKYPYLALNIYNLIPVCKTCNSTYKNQHKEEFLHAYFESFADNITFEVDKLTLPNIFNGKKIEVIIKNCAPENIRKRVDNQISILYLKERYEYFQNIIRSLIKKRIVFNKLYLHDISNFIGMNERDLELLLLQQDIFGDNEPFLKFKSDIWNQISNI